MALESLNAVDINTLLADLSDLSNEITIIIKDQLASTNDYLFELVNNNDLPLPKTVVLTETQTAGKGRQGRVWVSPPGNIYLSLYWPFACTLDKLYGLSLVVGIAIARVLRANGVEDVKLKWPNDVFWQGRKLGGILIETKRNKNGWLDAIIGIGLNIKEMDQFEQQINQKNVSLEDIMQHKIYRNKLIAQLLAELANVLVLFADKGFDHFIAEWKDLETIVNA